MKDLDNISGWLKFFLVILLLVIVNWISSKWYGQLDLTEDRKYTLSPSTKELIQDVDDVVYVRVLLDGKFPAGFKRLQEAVKDLLDDFRRLNPNIEYIFDDPLTGSPEQIKNRMAELAQRGIQPTRLNVVDSKSQEQQRIFPYALLNFGERQVAIRLLESQSRWMPPNQALNNSMALLEYKFADAIQKLFATERPNILFTEGHGELSNQQLADLENNLSAFYDLGRVNPEEVYQIPDNIDILIISKPVQPFSDTAKFVIDQYIMNGGKVVFLMDPLHVNLDSLAKYGQYVPQVNETGLDELFFKYGFRLKKNLVLDLECSPIALNTGSTGSLFPWYYHLAIAPNSDHPIVKSLDRINLQFPASIDTNVLTPTPVDKSVLLTSSQYTRTQVNPVMLDFAIVEVEPDPNQFNKSPEIVSLLLEGTFPSAYRNRVSQEMRKGLDELGVEFKETSEPTQILVVSDGDVARNLINPLNGEYRPLGFNKYDQITYDNREFLVNSIEYLLDRRGLIHARTKDLKLRWLNQPKVEEEKLWWQLTNVLLPILLVIMAGALLNWRRKVQYG